VPPASSEVARARLAAFLDPGRSLPEATEHVRLAERLGYESAWVSHIAGREPMQILGHYAHATERIGLGTAVVPIALRHPALLAMEAATLDEVSGGRLTLGIGISHAVTVEGWYGLRLDDPVGRMSEYSRIVRQLLTSGTSSFDGAHYVSRFAFSRYTPRPDIKILWAAMGPRMLRAAAGLADGVVLWMCSPEHIRRTIRPALESALEPRGRSFEDFDILAAAPVAMTKNVEAGRDAFRRQAFPYLNLPFYRKEVAHVHPETLARFDERMAERDVPGAMAALDDSFVDAYAGVGDAATVRAKIEDYRSAGVTLPGVGPLPRHDGGASVEETLRAAAPIDGRSPVV
jgi:alkanesulfonate monooxygenase SsuD/methylene tetrahydromethanopterin reductase-like flavin-dependent oxidoreductase (luciferase family)